MTRLPNFVNMISSNGNITALRLVEVYAKRNMYAYYRDGGDWECEYEEKNGELYSVSHIDSINGFKLVPTTEEKWRISNGSYAPSSFERYGLDTVSFGSNPCVEIPLPQVNDYMYILIGR